jgi:hypothetical protein
MRRSEEGTRMSHGERCETANFDRRIILVPGVTERRTRPSRSKFEHEGIQDHRINSNFAKKDPHPENSSNFCNRGPLNVNFRRARRVVNSECRLIRDWKQNNRTAGQPGLVGGIG